MPSTSPKQGPGGEGRDWYPYYAGFTTGFVQEVLCRRLPSAHTIFDPWNGAGTTTAVGASLGRRCTGLDINPVLTVIARARACPRSLSGSVAALAKEIVRAAGTQSAVRVDDPLRGWLRAPAVATVRALQDSIHTVAIDGSDFSRQLYDDPTTACDDMPVLASFFYTGLFAVVRDTLMPFRAANPSWLRAPASASHKLNPSARTLHHQFISRIAYFSTRLAVASPEAADDTIVRTGSALQISEKSAFDACLTSPPYATRIDYVKNSLSELAVLGASPKLIAELRRETTGTPVVRGTVRRPTEELASESARGAVEFIRTHGSHGSSNYYAPWIGNYFADLQTSLRGVASAVKPNGRICIVVQDSHYKARHIDLQQVVVEMLDAVGRRLVARDDFDVVRSRAQMNPRARKHLLERKNLESLLVFE